MSGVCFIKCPASPVYGLEVLLENLWGCWSAGAAELTVWLAGNRQLLLSLEGCGKHKQYGHGERARTTHPYPFEWKLTPASDLDKCSNFIQIHTPEWYWRYQNGSLLIAANPRQSPQKEMDHFASTLNLPQMVLHSKRENQGFRGGLRLCTSADAIVWPPVRGSCWRHCKGRL